MCITPVPGHSEWIATGRRNGAVHLWDIEKGARACECMNGNAGLHVQLIVQLEEKVDEIVASPTRLLCLHDDEKKVTIVNLSDTSACPCVLQW